MYRYVFSPEARDQLRKLPIDKQKIIIYKLDHFLTSETPLFYAKKLHDYSLGSYRFRIGDYRVVFDIKEHVLIVLAVGHRRDIYKR